MAAVANRLLEKSEVEIDDNRFILSRPGIDVSKQTEPLSAEGKDVIDNAIEVQCRSIIPSEDALSLYFENKRSGGGPISAIRYFKDENRAIIVFENSKGMFSNIKIS